MKYSKSRIEPPTKVALSLRSGLGRLVAKETSLFFAPAFACLGTQRHWNNPVGGTNGQIWKSGK
jgi:hypothetical protein